MTDSVRLQAISFVTLHAIAMLTPYNVFDAYIDSDIYPAVLTGSAVTHLALSLLLPHFHD